MRGKKKRAEKKMGMGRRARWAKGKAKETTTARKGDPETRGRNQFETPAGRSRGSLPESVSGRNHGSSRMAAAPVLKMLLDAERSTLLGGSWPSEWEFGSDDKRRRLAPAVRLGRACVLCHDAEPCPVAQVRMATVIG